MPTVKYRGRDMTYEEKLLAHEEERIASPRREILVDHMQRAVGRNAWIVLWLIYALLLFARQLSSNEAENKVEYFVSNDQPGYVVISMEDDLLVLAGYEPETHMLSGAYRGCQTIRFKTVEFPEAAYWKTREARPMRRYGFDLPHRLAACDTNAQR